MKHSLVLLACTAALAACNKGPEVHAKNASVEDVAKQVRDSGVGADSFLHAGQWKATSNLEEMNIPGMPPEAQAQMKSALGKAQNASFEYCLTEEEAKKPGGKVFTGKENKNCRYESFNMSGGKIDAVMHCQGDGGGTMTLKVNGTYSPDSYESRAELKTEGGRQGGMTMKMRTEAHRIGQCTAKGGDVKVTMGGKP
jgi:hypothetical protein